MKNKKFREWENNRGRSFRQKFTFWKARPVGAIIRIVEFLTLRTSQQNLIRSHNDINEIKHLLNDLEVDGNDDYIIKNARISTASALILLESGHVIARHLDSHSYLSGSLIDELRALVRKRELTQFDGIILLLPMQTYYYHFLIDFLPYVLRAVKKYPRIRVVLHNNNPKFVFNYLNMHGLSYETTDKEILYIEKLVAINFTGMKIQDVKKSLQISGGGGVVKIQKIAFLRNRGARFDLNFEKKVAQFLADRGYSIFDPDTLTLEEQISLFSNADAIAAIHGGVLANLIYCKGETKVLEIFSHPYRTYFFQALSENLNLDYESMETDDFS